MLFIGTNFVEHWFLFDWKGDPRSLRAGNGSDPEQLGRGVAYMGQTRLEMGPLSRFQGRILSFVSIETMGSGGPTPSLPLSECAVTCGQGESLRNIRENSGSQIACRMRLRRASKLGILADDSNHPLSGRRSAAPTWGGSPTSVAAPTTPPDARPARCLTAPSSSHPRRAPSFHPGAQSSARKAALNRCVLSRNASSSAHGILLNRRMRGASSQKRRPLRRNASFREGLYYRASEIAVSILPTEGTPGRCQPLRPALQPGLWAKSESLGVGSMVMTAARLRSTIGGGTCVEKKKPGFGRPSAWPLFRRSPPVAWAISA